MDLPIEFWDLREKEEKEGRIHPVPRLRADLASEGEPRRQLEDRDGGGHLPRGHQLRRDALHPQIRGQVRRRITLITPFLVTTMNYVNVDRSHSIIY